MPNSPTITSGSTAGLAPDCLVEIDGLLATAEDAFAMFQDGPVFARDAKGEIRRITEAHRHEASTTLLEIEHEALPWPLRIAEDQPVLVSTEGSGGGWKMWKTASELTTGDEVLLPEGPLHDELVTSGYHVSGPGFHNPGAETYRYTRPHSGITIFGLSDLMEVEPMPGRKISVAGLPRPTVFRIERAFGLEGSKYDRRTSSQAASVRREMAECGMPLSAIGADGACLREWVLAWSELRDGVLEMHLTPDRFAFEGRERWRARKPYESARTLEDRMRQAAYVVYRMLHSAKRPGTLVQLDETSYRLDLKGLSASMALFTEHERVTLRRDRFLRGPAIRSAKMDGHRYICSRIQKIGRIQRGGPIYSFCVDGASSLVAVGDSSKTDS